MASYDTFNSGHMDQLPGMAPRDPHGWGTAPGSAGAGADGAEQIMDMAANLAATSKDRPLVVPVQDTLSAGVRVPVHPTDVLVGPQVDLYSGQAGALIDGGVAHEHFGRTGAGEGGYGHFKHPNAESYRPEGHE